MKRPYKAEAARQVIAALEKAGMLKEVTGRKWGQLFVARPILKVIEKPFAA